jgi:NADPH:quinone reductase
MGEIHFGGTTMQSLPSRMRCIEVSTPGAPDVLRVAERALPQPKAQEILIKVAAAGVNRADCYQRQGAYLPPPGASDILGLELSGTVAALGASVERWQIGDKVCALVSGGAYAQYCTAHQGSCLAIPSGYDWIKAAALPETFMTVWSNVWERAALKPGETLLVQGGSSGIGTTAIQLAKALGNRVFATAGSREKCKACEALGAERAIDYKTEDFVEVVKLATQGRGVDVILDMVAGDYIAREIAALAEEGRIVVISLQGGAKATIDVALMMRRRLTLTGSTLRARDDAYKGGLARRVNDNVWPLLEAGKIAPVIHATFALDDAAQAHRLMESSAHIGKIILTV